MNERPIVFLAFANQQDNYLPMLKQESRNINKALQHLHDKGVIEVFREESASIDLLVEGLTRFRNRIAIFHYAGHADGQGLFLEDTAADATGLASLLAQLNNLKLVFLNGCCTKAQVERLMGLGVGAVVATSTTIHDTYAVELAEHFYRALSSKNSIQDAFKFAVATLQMRYGGSEIAQIYHYRGFGDANDTNPIIAWGLYINPNANGIADWTLPVLFSPTAVSAPKTPVEYELNQYLGFILDSMATYDTQIEQMIYDATGDRKIDGREALAMIIEKFPWSIGIQIRLLVSSEDDMRNATLMRLRQIISTYTATGQLMYYILLSQIWEEMRSKRLPVDWYFIDILALDQRNFIYYDFPTHIIQAVKTLKENNINLFAIEFENFYRIFNEKEQLYNSYLYLEGLKTKLSENPAMLNVEIGQICADAEFALSVFLVEAAFLIKYPMITIRDISVYRPRYRDAKFNHFFGRLNANATYSLDLMKKPLSFDSFMNSNSVILVQSLEKAEPYLNLSPFVVDKNAFGDFRATEPHLFMYAHKKQDEYLYITTARSLFKAMEQEADQFDTGFTEVAETIALSQRINRTKGGRTENRKPFAALKELFDSLKADFA